MASDTKTTPRVGDYEVGFGKPPQRTRWKPGQSGNDKGRPKNSKNKKSEYLVVMNQRHKVNINGRLVYKPAFQIMLEQAKLQAMQGSLKAMAFLFKLGFDLDALKTIAVDAPQHGVIVIPQFIGPQTPESQLENAYKYQAYLQSLKHEETAMQAAQEGAKREAQTPQPKLMPPQGRKA